MPARSVQFYGFDSIIKAAENRNCPTWGIFTATDRQFLFKCQGSSMQQSIDLLRQTLTCLEQSTSTAIYTIKFYEEDEETKKPLKIKENTPCDGSFNFRMFNEEERDEHRAAFISRDYNNDRLDKLEKKLDAFLDKFDDDDEIEDEPETIEHAFIGMIQDPSKLSQFISSIGAAKQLFSGNPGSQPTPRMHSIGSLTPQNGMGQNPGIEDPGPADQVANLSQDQQTKMQRIAAALDILEKCDPDIIVHLEKIAIIAQQNPKQYQFLTSMLQYS